MLKGIPSIINPELLKAIAEMGHGDEIVIGDGNFPATTMGKQCIRCDGHGVNQLLEAILQLFPLDSSVEAPITLMEVVPGSIASLEPPIWAEFRQTIEKHAPGTKIGFEERFNFYDRSKKAFACIQTGESALYACVILKKGVIGK